MNGHNFPAGDEQNLVKISEYRHPNNGASILLLLALAGCVMLFLALGVARLRSQREASAAVLRVGGALSPVFTAEVHYWTPEIVRWANSYGLDPNMVATVMQIESCGNPAVASPAGAQGLFQVMPFHFQAGENPLDPQTNALRGLSFLADLLQQTGDHGLAFAGYNGGPGAAFSSWDNWAAETQHYYYWSTGIYGEASSGADQSARLQEWLDAGGASLCRQAARELRLD